MATPHVAGAAALLAAAHPGARPSQIKAALVAAATFDWRTKTDPDGRPDPLLDVSRLGPLPDFSVRAADATDELAHGGVTRIDVTIERDGVGHAPIAVRAVDLPDGITAEVAPVPTTGSSVAIWLRADGSASNGEGSFTVRATDGDLVRTASASFRVRAGGPTIAFTAPDGGADGVRITDGDQATIAFTETDPGAPPVERRVLRQAGTPVTPGTCADVDWSAVGDPVTPGELDPGGSVEAGWSFTADLAEDGCTRWLVRLIDEDGGSARFASPAVLRDTRDPGKPAVTLEGEGVARAGTTVWVRGGTGSLVLIASGVDVGSGVASHTWGELSVPDGWSVEPGPGGDGSAITLSWGPEAADTTIGVRATDATGRTGPARTMALRVDGTGPRANGWFDPPSRTDRVSGSIVELGWRAIEDAESGPASLQRVQRQVAKPVRGACAGVAWTDDGPSRLVTPRDEQWDLRSGRCYRWILTPRDAVGNAGKPAVSGSVFVDLLAPKADFLAPDEGTVRVTTASRVRVAWTELRREGGGESFRTLERERVAAVGDTCPELGWVRQGAIDDGPSPSRSVGLKPGYCYRWRLNTSDSRDNVASELSGIVRVVAPEP
jgi:hypothetical protein